VRSCDCDCADSCADRRPDLHGPAVRPRPRQAHAAGGWPMRTRGARWNRVAADVRLPGMSGAAPAFAVRVCDWAADAAALRQIRLEVFVVEQRVPEALEWDDADAESI